MPVTWDPESQPRGCDGGDLLLKVVVRKYFFRYALNSKTKRIHDRAPACKAGVPERLPSLLGRVMRLRERFTGAPVPSQRARSARVRTRSPGWRRGAA